jgi:hypothetical protein
LLSALVVAQVALSLALLSISALLLRTLRNVTHANPGFEQDHILTASVGLNISSYTDAQVEMIRHKILDRMSTVPGVTIASLTDWVPIDRHWASFEKWSILNRQGVLGRLSF